MLMGNSLFFYILEMQCCHQVLALPHTTDVAVDLTIGTCSGLVRKRDSFFPTPFHILDEDLQYLFKAQITHLSKSAQCKV